MSKTRIVATACAAFLISNAAAAAQSQTASVPPLEAEHASSETLGALKPHWFFVYDWNSPGYLDSKVYLFDGDSGSMLGMLSTGAWGNAIELAPDHSAIYVPEMYYSRGSRGERTDVLTIYDAKQLNAVGEVVIPPKRATGIPQRAYQGMSDDGRFVFVDNMTPATSISVVDVVGRKFVGEIEISGCNLVYPIGNRAFASLCGDGTVQTVMLDDQGIAKSRLRSAKFFDPDKDPVTEKASRYRDTWLFVSFDGYVHPVTFANGAATPGKVWSLFTDAERSKGWKVGGYQFTAVHSGLGRLFVGVHQGKPFGHKEPATSIWTYDLSKSTKIGVIELKSTAESLAVTKDGSPLLITDAGSHMGSVPIIQIYEALSGRHLRTIDPPPVSPGFIQTP